MGHENLGFLFQSAKGTRMYNPIAISLEWCACGRLRLCKVSSAGIAPVSGEGRKELLSLFERTAIDYIISHD